MISINANVLVGLKVRRWEEYPWWQLNENGALIESFNCHFSWVVNRGLGRERESSKMRSNQEFYFPWEKSVIELHKWNGANNPFRENVPTVEIAFRGTPRELFSAVTKKTPNQNLSANFRPRFRKVHRLGHTLGHLSVDLICFFRSAENERFGSSNFRQKEEREQFHPKRHSHRIEAIERGSRSFLPHGLISSSGWIHAYEMRS